MNRLSILALVVLFAVPMSIGCGGRSSTTIEPTSESDLELMRKITAEGGGVEETEEKK